MRKPLTVAEMIAKLQTFPADAVVMIECADDYYSGAVYEEDLSISNAVLVGPHEGPHYNVTTMKPDESTMQYPAGWHIQDDDDVPAVDHVLDRKQCVKIWAE